jgi:hypothetical protein
LTRSSTITTVSSQEPRVTYRAFLLEVLSHEKEGPYTLFVACHRIAGFLTVGKVKILAGLVPGAFSAIATTTLLLIEPVDSFRL